MHIPSFPYLSDLVFFLTGVRLPLPFAMFGMFVAFGALAASACLGRELRRMEAAASVPPGTHEKVGTFTLVVLVAGVAGARLFHILENLDDFLAHPAALVFSRSGLSVFGGLLAGMAAGFVLLRRWKLAARPFLDAIAPALMLGYGIGRIGCQISGDGDWGVASDPALKPAWLPTWLWSQTYDNNIAGVLIQAPGVYPTPMYETAMALACFAVLWAVRRHPFRTGWLFGLYLLLAGVERLLIEQIRVNPKFHVFGLALTQAELIAMLFIAAGAAGMALTWRSPSAAHTPRSSPR